MILPSLQRCQLTALPASQSPLPASTPASPTILTPVELVHASGQTSGVDLQ